MSERCYIRARDLRPGDVLPSHGEVLEVKDHGASVHITIRYQGRHRLLGVALADDWVEIIPEPEVAPATIGDAE